MIPMSWDRDSKSVFECRLNEYCVTLQCFLLLRVFYTYFFNINKYTLFFVQVDPSLLPCKKMNGKIDNERYIVVLVIEPYCHFDSV